MRYESDVISKRIKRSQKIKKFLNIILYIILIPTILFSLFLMFGELGNSKENPSFLNISLYSVVSESMSPRIKVNDIVVVKKGYSNDEFREGNIITFKKDNGEIVTHRIEKIVLSDLQNSYITKGDNNENVDEKIVRYEDIIGKVIYVMPNLGNMFALFKNKYFFIGCMTVLVLVTLYDLRVKKRKIERKKIREKYEKKSNFYF